MGNQEKFDELFNKSSAYRDNGDIPGQTKDGKWVSRAICRRTNEGVDDTTGINLYTDGNLYDLLTFWLAVECRDPFSVETVNLGAAGKLPANRPEHIARFKAVQTRMNQTR